MLRTTNSWSDSSRLIMMCLFAAWIGWHSSLAGAPSAPESMYVGGWKRIYLVWPPSPDYRIHGYNIRRTLVDGAGKALKETGGIYPLPNINEYAGPMLDAPHYYQVQAEDILGRVSGWSPPSPTTQAGGVTVFIPHIRLNTLGISDLYRRIDDNNPLRSVVRIPIAVLCANDLDAADGFDIVTAYPPELSLAGDGFAVNASGVTVGLPLTADWSNPGEIHISSGDAGEEKRPLFGAGIMFNAYIPVPALSAASDMYELAVSLDETWFHDTDFSNVELDAIAGSIQMIPDAPIYGDADGDGDIDGNDPRRILSAIDGGADPVDLAHDMNLDALVDGADAIIIQRWINRLDREIAAPMKANPAISKAYADAGEDFHPAVSIDPVAGNPGDTVQALLTIDSGTESLIMAGFSVVLTFPSSPHALEYVEAVPGEIWPEGEDSSIFDAIAEANGDGTGALRISLVSTEGLDAAGLQTLAVVTFTIGDEAVPNSSYPVIIQSFEAHDQYGQTPRHNAPGQPKSNIITGAVVATVSSSDGGKGIADAFVRLDNLGRTGDFCEDSPNVYVFPAIPDGTYSLVAQAQGHSNAQQTVMVSGGQIVSASLTMQCASCPEEEGEEEGEKKDCEKIIALCGPVAGETGVTWGDWLCALIASAALLILCGCRRFAS